MAGGSPLETSAFEAQDHAAGNGNCDRERELRARRRITRRDQAAESDKTELGRQESRRSKEFDLRFLMSSFDSRSGLAPPFPFLFSYIPDSKSVADPNP